MEALSVKKVLRKNIESRMPAWSEFHTEGASTLKPREAKVVWTRVGRA